MANAVGVSTVTGAYQGVEEEREEVVILIRTIEKTHDLNLCAFKKMECLH